MSPKLGKRKMRLLAEKASGTSPTYNPSRDTDLNEPPPPRPPKSSKGRNKRYFGSIILSAILIAGIGWFLSHHNAEQNNSGLALDSLSRKIEKERVQVMILFESPEGRHFHESGGGFVINGKYVVTCYHLQAAFPYKVVGAYVNYLVRMDDTLRPYDSIPIDLSYKPKITQYDFHKHQYDSTDHRTDVMVYKLQRELNPNPLSFASQVKFGDSVYSIANIPETPESGDFYNTAARGEYLFDFPEKMITPTTPGFKFKFVIGNFKHGFSGSAVYDKHGNILGIYLFEKDGDYQPLPGYISQQASADIADGHAKGWTVGAFIPIEYLKKTYLGGYIDDNK